MNESLDAIAHWREKQIKLMNQHSNKELTPSKYKEQSKLLNAEYKKCIKEAKEAIAQAKQQRRK